MLPKDPVILLSFINTKLRDEYSSLEDLCAALDADAQELSATLNRRTSPVRWPPWTTVTIPRTINLSDILSKGGLHHV